MKKAAISALTVTALLGLGGCAGMSDRDKSTAIGAGVGAVGGAVVGGVLGHQVGGGSGKQIATVVGAVVGNEVEKRVKTIKSYEITVRLDDDTVRVINEANPTSWRTGDRVRIIDGEIRAI